MLRKSRILFSDAIIRSIENSDVCIHVIDATRGFEAQDQRIFHIADRNKKGIIILNKWDLVNKIQIQQ